MHLQHLVQYRAMRLAGTLSRINYITLIFQFVYFSLIHYNSGRIPHNSTMATSRQSAMIYFGDAYLQTVREDKENAAMDKAQVSSRIMNSKVWHPEWKNMIRYCTK